MLPGGIDVFYIDESHDNRLYVVSALAIPLIRPTDAGMRIVWADYFEAMKIWRKEIADHVDIPKKRELHGVKLASGRGNFYKGRYNFSRAKASGAYRRILRSLTFLPEGAIMSASATRANPLYGNTRLSAAMYALFQRMRTQCAARRVNAIVFFDQGHPEYRKLYRQAQVFLPTGSRLGGWDGGAATRNMPLDMFFKDGNEKSSKECFFTQVADLIAYSAFLKRKHEEGQLTDWQSAYNLGNLYDEIPRDKINTLVYQRNPRDGIVRV